MIKRMNIGFVSLFSSFSSTIFFFKTLLVRYDKYSTGMYEQYVVTRRKGDMSEISYRKRRGEQKQKMEKTKQHNFIYLFGCRREVRGGS